MNELKVPYQVVGNYFLLKGKPSKQTETAIREVVTRQVALRGDDKSFKFKAFGCTWQYRPT
jgi:hypothetical protein